MTSEFTNQNTRKPVYDILNFQDNTFVKVGTIANGILTVTDDILFSGGMHTPPPNMPA